MMLQKPLAPLVAGLLFGSGLILSEMINPAKVRGFLDVFGAWDPTLAFVMAGALLVTTLGFKLLFRRDRPLLTGRFHLPEATQIDKPLILGAMLFGIGWGLSGLCPGPALVGIVTANRDVLLFFIAMIAGMILFSLWEHYQRSSK